MSDAQCTHQAHIRFQGLKLLGMVWRATEQPEESKTFTPGAPHDEDEEKEKPKTSSAEDKQEEKEERKEGKEEETVSPPRTASPTIDDLD